MYHWWITRQTLDRINTVHRACTNHTKSRMLDEKVKEVKRLQKCNSIYEKVVKIHGVFIKSYIDTGS